MTLYTAKCFWPGVTEDELRLAATRASHRSAGHGQAVFRGALYLPTDDLVLCLFDSPSKPSVKRASEEAGMPCERVIDTVWIEPQQPTEKEFR